MHKLNQKPGFSDPAKGCGSFVVGFVYRQTDNIAVFTKREVKKNPPKSPFDYLFAIEIFSILTELNTFNLVANF